MELTTRTIIEAESTSQSQTELLGYAFANKLKKGDFVAMYGDLGAGKTAFVRGVARKLCPEAFVSSPTYTIVNEYSDDKNTIYHFDMYRIDSFDDLLSIGYYDYLDGGICIAEWCEKIEDDLPLPRYVVVIDKTGEESRSVVISEITKEEDNEK